MYFLIYGEDDHRSRRTLAAARAKFFETRDRSGLNAAVLRAKDDGLDAAAEAIFASPFLAEKKLVVLEGYLRDLPPAEQEKLGGVIDRQPDSTVVIFYEDAGAAELRKSPLFDRLAKQKYSVECPALQAGEVARFIKAECAAAGMNIEPRAVQTLTALVGADAWRLHQETAKLCAYAAGLRQPAVTESMVGELVSGGQEEPVFAFLDACTEGRSGPALSALEKLFSAGVPELQITAMLLRHFRLMITARDYLERGGRDAETLARKLGQHPFPVGKALAAARRFSYEFLRECYGELVDIDRQAKTGLAKPRVLLDIFAARLTAACAVRADA